MAIEHVNRRGETYYLLQGKTKTGKPKYYVSRKPGATPVETMPEGYELYENPERGLVSVRKIRPSRIDPKERALLETKTRELAGINYFYVDIQEDSLVIYTPATDPGAAASILNKVFGGFSEGTSEGAAWISSFTNYHPMYRFTLIDAEKRLFSAERWCFLGAIDDWFPVSGGQRLEKLANKLLPHLNNESFFELM
jgi:hypothetical protein